MTRADPLNPNPWSPEEDAIIRQAVRNGASAGAIVSMLTRRTERSVQNRAKRLGLNMVLRSNQVARASPQGLDSEIIKLCRYIKSDSYIANYLGTKRERVEALRRRTPVVARDGQGVGRPRAPVAEVPMSMDAEMKASTAARMGSKALRDAMLALYGRRAEATASTIQEAMIACLYGTEAAARFITTKGTVDA